MILNNADNLIVGSNQVQSVYLGSRLVWSGSVLPAGYTMLEYIESSKHQQINTGIIVGDTAQSRKVFECDIQLLDISTNTVAFGSAYEVDKQYFIVCTNVNYDGFIMQSYPWSFSVLHGTKDIDRHYLKVDMQNETFFVDSQTIKFGRGSIINDDPIYIFIYNGASGRATSARLYSFKVEDDGELIQNMIPVLDPSGVPCVYDTVAHSPIYNSGTGTFGYKKLDGTIVAPT